MTGGGKRGSGAAAGPAVAAASIPAGSRKMVQSLKEIVNCSEAEIYAMLKECNMDPSEAVHRLLTQDTFHEVKSKREKKKEIKDTPESRSRSVNNNPSRGARGGADRGACTSFNQITSKDYGVHHAKLVYKKENETNSISTSSIAGSGTVGSNLNRRSTAHCEIVPVPNTTQVTAMADGPSLPSQPPSGFQHNWSRMPGQLSMADIVRMGRPQGKLSSGPVASDTFHALHDPIMPNMPHQSAMQAPTITAPSESVQEFHTSQEFHTQGKLSSGPVASDMFHTLHDPNMPNMPHQSAMRAPTITTPSESAQEFHTSQDPVLQDDERSHEIGTSAGHYNSHDDWSLIGETSQGSGPTHPEISGASIYTDLSASSSLVADEDNLDQDSRLNDNQLEEGDANGDCLPTESIRSASISDGQIEVDNSGNSTLSEDDPLNDMSHHSQMHVFQHHEVKDVNEEISSTTANLQQLNLQEGELGAPSADDNPAVIIPSHLQVTNSDCSHLSFGSFGSSVNATPGLFSPKPPGTNLEMDAVPEDTLLDQLNSRNPEYYDGEQLKSTLNENMTSRTSTSTRSYDMPSASRSEHVRDDPLDAARGLRGNFPSVSGYEFLATTQPTATYTYPDPISQMQNLSPLSSLMQPYTNSLPSSLPSSLLAQSAQPPREFDLPFSALLTTQSMPVKYNTTPPSISGTISMPEVNPEVFSVPQPTPQALLSSNIHNAGGPALPQHLPIHPYSQPTLPLGHFANMISYPFLPQSYTFLPSAAFQQAYTSSSPFHQLPAAAAMKYSPLPQYKSSISGSSLPQSPALPPGYGGFTSSTNNPSNFSLNPSAVSASSTMGFEEALSSQYKEGSHYLQPQHNENSAMWVHGAGSRTVSAHLGSTFYGFQGQQQNGGVRQPAQQPSQYGPMGYLNLHQSQGGPVQEQHPQNPTEGNLSGSQGPASHQVWQHGF